MDVVVARYKSDKRMKKIKEEKYEPKLQHDSVSKNVFRLKYK